MGIMIKRRLYLKKNTPLLLHSSYQSTDRSLPVGQIRYPQKINGFGKDILKKTDNQYAPDTGLES